jgi:dihydrofolate reductase|tara:strand:+ start:872 stop:1390 length:519 start_codon:yes stop_codon:yes gene_type:complete
MRISLIVAMAKNRIIGIDGGMPWKISEDLRFFKSVTMGHPIIMGRKTYESIGGALVGRTNILITRNHNFAADGIEICYGIEEALEQAKAFEELWGRDDIQPEVFVIGGAEIYNQALEFVDRIYLTEIQATPKGDAYFPDFVRSDWFETDRQDRPPESSEGDAYSFVILDRKQ